MKRRNTILAGTALGLLMASTPVRAATPAEPTAPVSGKTVIQRSILLAQSSDSQPAEEVLPQTQEAPAERKAPVEEPAPEPAPAPAAEPQQQAEPPVEQPKAAEPEPKPAPAPEAAPQPEPEAAPKAEPQPEAPKAEPQPEAKPEPAAKEQPKAEEKPKARQQRNSEEAKPAAKPEAGEAKPAPAAAPEGAAEPQPQAEPEKTGGDAKSGADRMRQEMRKGGSGDAKQGERRRPRDGQPAADDATKQAPAAAPAEAPAQTPPAEAPAAETPAATPPAEAPAEAAAPEAAKPTTMEQPPAREPTKVGPAPAEPVAGTPLPENAAPVLDSAKEAPQQPAAAQPGAAAQPQQPAQPAQPAAPPPTSDAAAQSDRSRPADIQSVREERGRRIEVDRDQPRRWERRENVDVVKEFDNRIILNFGGQDFVESSDRDRLGRGSRDTYYEELPRGRTRETIVRRDGTQVVTIRNEYGDVIRRSRITPDNREYVLSYVDEDEYARDRGREWRDPGEDLPPLVLTIPARDYILDAGSVDDDSDRYYDFLDQPPVERIERLYSVEEVKRSARVRDTVRRVDLDTITFATGSADVAESQVDRLAGVAEGMQKLLKRNPAETFLIEGHTDAVGSDQSNLVLSDRRAEAVADALSRYFDIPPENLATQGYGERYLKIKSDGAEQENRRVAIRRITALVAPASASAK